MLMAGALTGLLSGCDTMQGDTSPKPTVKPVQPSQGSSGKAAQAPQNKGLPPPSTSRNWQELRLQAARRLVAANPDITYLGRPQDVLLAIPVLTIELNADGSIRRLDVMRYPKQARDTVEIAKEAVRRAAPFGDVSRLPKPWKFNETFLFSDQRKFKPMTLDR
jgi:hypothetical protein